MELTAVEANAENLINPHFIQLAQAAGHIVIDSSPKKPATPQPIPLRWIVRERIAMPDPQPPIWRQVLPLTNGVFGRQR